ncbi:MAG: TAXI family TRAP transporter solute-binding subunit [Alicyclobacillus sp.]|nr:TAXI family TRAP transporter solute-binding subunit [Alicyclobacillus sp.]
MSPINQVKNRSLRWLAVVGLACCIGIAGCGGSSGSGGSGGAAPAQASQANKPAAASSGQLSTIAIGTSSVGSDTYNMGTGFAKIISDKLGIPAKSVAFGGGDAVVHNMENGRTQMGIVSTSILLDAYQGQGSFQKKVPVRVLIMAKRAQPRQLVVRADAGIKTPADLEGKTVVGIRPAIADIQQFMNAIISAYHLDKSKIHIVSTTDTNEAINDLEQGSVQAAILPGDLRASFLTQMDQKIDVDWIGFPNDKLQAILKQMGPGFTVAEIPAGTYKNVKENLQTIGSNMTLSVLDSFPDDVAYNIVKTILNDPEEVKQFDFSGKDYLISDSLPQPPIPYKEGALKYYREKGLVKN